MTDSERAALNHAIAGAADKRDKARSPAERAMWITLIAVLLAIGGVYVVT